MVIYNPYIGRPNWRPTKYDTPLIIDADRVIARALSMKRFQAITGWH